MLTGAGLSTDSGIPDYRGPDSPARMPMTYQEFVSGPEAQQRYWARSHLGWGRMRRADPNAGHRALARLDPELLITQNVDGLHEAGRLAAAGRAARPDRRRGLPGLPLDVAAGRAAGAAGRAEPRLRRAARRRPRCGPTATSSSTTPADFVVPGCASCGGVLKPDVVFFGENVPAAAGRALLRRGRRAGRRGGALLVAGSSLTVMSGFRFVRRAARAGTPVVIVNRGATRGDDLATYKLEVGCSEFLGALARLTSHGKRALHTASYPSGKCANSLVNQ